LIAEVEKLKKQLEIIKKEYELKRKDIIAKILKLREDEFYKRMGITRAEDLKK